MDGSSPHARGLPVGNRLDLRHQRIIPARAGFTRAGPRRILIFMDHPRTRGVYGSTQCRPHSIPGSSPHARGLLIIKRSAIPNRGIIPARAGFTRGGLAYLSGTGDHPRTRGVYPECSRPPVTRPGSSPHARGLPGGLGEHHADRRIIPARAGFTASRPPWYRPAADHPRMRGVYNIGCSQPRRWTGSSPHARGLRPSHPSAHPSSGIIPACAGFTVRDRAKRFGLGDHPRMRGVYGIQSVRRDRVDGSSPHARGLHRREWFSPWLPGIIPACAGFTSAPRSSPTTRPDHPRMRGVYVVRGVLGHGVSGSSPHARGLPRHVPAPAEGRGIIPACAGFTCRWITRCSTR